MSTPSRGDAVSGYYPHFEGTSGVKIYKDNLKGQAITGNIVSANVVYAVNHQLKKVPSVVIITPWLASNQAKNFTSGGVVGESKASAATSAKFYVIGNLGALKYKAFLLI